MMSINSPAEILNLLNDIATNVSGSSPIQKQSIPHIQQKFQRANAYLTPFLEKLLEKHYLKDEDVSQIFQHLKWTYDKDESTDLIKTLILSLGLYLSLKICSSAGSRPIALPKSTKTKRPSRLCTIPETTSCSLPLNSPKIMSRSISLNF